ncbi:MAG TPA: SdpI family protein [Allosphingosinicella sp.]
MTRRTMGVAAILTTLAIVAVGLAVGFSVPADMQLPIHWGLSGEPDRFSDKWTALLMPAVIIGGVSALLWFLPALEPRKEGLARSQGLYFAAWIGLLLVGATVELAVVSVALGWDVPTNRLICIAVGTMLVLIGNQLGKSRSMYMIGVRTPWTLASEEVWIRTHRLAGKLMVAAGLVAILLAVLPVPTALMMQVMIVAVLAAGIIPVAYSWLLWRRECQPSE